MTLGWSNGPVEGQINRLKMLKRTMYGRAGLDLLGRRFLSRRMIIKSDTAGEFPLSNFGHQCSELRASWRCQNRRHRAIRRPDQVHRCRNRDVLKVGLGLTDIT